MNFIKVTFLVSIFSVLSIGNIIEGHAEIKTAADAQKQISMQQKLAQSELNESKLTQIKIDNLSQEYRENKKIIENQARDAQINQVSDKSSVLGILLNSKNITDFLLTINSETKLQESQQIHLESQKELLKDLKLQESKENTALDKANKALNEAEKEYKTLSTKEQQEFLIQQKSESSDNVLSSVTLSVKPTSVLSNGVTEVQKLSLTSDSIKAEKILSVANQHLGVPYAWGGTTPSGWDCSGFTSFVYRKALGLEIGRSTYDQMASGHSIPYNQAQPGDLLIFDGGSPVVIYVGNNKMINAQNSRLNLLEA